MERIQRTHRFFDKYTIPGALVLMVIGLVVGQLLGFAIGLLLSRITGDKIFGAEIGTIIISPLLLWAYKYWFRPEFEGNCRGGNLKLGMKLSLIFVVYWIITIPLGFLFTGAVFGAPTVNSIILSVMAGVSEETAFRGLPISYLMRQWRDEKHILTAVLLTSGTFGLIHLANIFSGGNPAGTLVQGVSAVCMGIILGAIYLRSGNLLVTILLHALHDIIALTDVSGIQDGIVVAGFNWSSLIDIVATMIMGIIGLWLIRPAKRGEIRAMWDKKWGIDADQRVIM